MKTLYDNIEVKIITEFCKTGIEIPKSLRNNKMLKEKIKEYYRFTRKQNALTEEEMNFLTPEGSCLWVKNNFKPDDTILLAKNKNTQEIVHSFINRNGIFIDILGETEDLSAITDELPNEKDLDYSFFNELEDFLQYILIK